MNFRFLDRDAAMALTPYTSVSGFYAAVAAGLMPQPRQIGARAVRWRSDELEAALANLPRAQIGSEENKVKLAKIKAAKAERDALGVAK